MKVAIVYDRVNKWGGAERVLLSLHKIFKDAPLFTSVYGQKNTSWAKVFDVKTSFLQKFPFLPGHNEYFPFLMPIAFESLDLSEYDVVISVTSEAAKGIITRPNAIHICICLTPTRYLWSGFDVYFKNPLLRLVSSPITYYLKKWDLMASSRPDYYIAISNEVKKRIKKYYKRDSTLIYPGIEFSNKGIENETTNDYFLVVSRLSKFVSYKRVDLVVDAFNKSGKKLKIVGTGSLLKKLKEKAKDNIEFLGMVNDEELEELYSNCIALVFPAVEDFGLVMVEAQSFGKPIIAYRGGGALEIVEEGKTGEFFDKQDSESLFNVLKTFDASIYNSKAIKEASKRFSFERFKKEIVDFVNKRYEQNRSNL